MWIYFYGLLDGISYYQILAWRGLSSSWQIFQDGYSYSMQEDYDNITDCSALLWTCLETLWPSNDHDFWKRCYICQHLLQDSLEIARHKILFVDNFPSLEKWTDGSCESLGSTTTTHVQPQVSSDMGWEPPIYTTHSQLFSAKIYEKELIWYLLWISTLIAHWID